VPFAAPISRSISLGASARGSRRRLFGRSSLPAGLSSRRPSSTRWRKNVRAAAARRATELGA
jgi:hypothetical protein